jgi:hypothetical protein
MGRTALNAVGIQGKNVDFSGCAALEIEEK